MNYREICEILKSKKISFNVLSELVGMTNKGLKYSLENDTLPASKVKKLCEIMGITPNDFFAPSVAGGSVSQRAVCGRGDVHQVATVYNGGSGNGGAACAECTLLAAKEQTIEAQQATIVSQQRMIECLTK